VDDASHALTTLKKNAGGGGAKAIATFGRTESNREYRSAIPAPLVVAVPAAAPHNAFHHSRTKGLEMIKEKHRCALAGIILAATLSIGAVATSPSEASRASINVSIAIPVTLVNGTANLFRDAGQFSVTGVKTAGQVSTIALRGLASGVEGSVQVSSKAIEGSALAVGSVLHGSVSATGTLLISAGKALMFVPNEVGLALMHHSRARD
jgi:hypothetical protein